METFPGATIGAMKKLDARGAGSGLADGEPSEEEKT